MVEMNCNSSCGKIEGCIPLRGGGRSDSPNDIADLRRINLEAGTFPGAESILWYQGRGPREKQYRRRNP